MAASPIKTCLQPQRPHDLIAEVDCVVCLALKIVANSETSKTCLSDTMDAVWYDRRCTVARRRVSRNFKLLFTPIKLAASSAMLKSIDSTISSLQPNTHEWLTKRQRLA